MLQAWRAQPAPQPATPRQGMAGQPGQGHTGREPFGHHRLPYTLLSNGTIQHLKQLPRKSMPASPRQGMAPGTTPSHHATYLWLVEPGAWTEGPELVRGAQCLSSGYPGHAVTRLKGLWARTSSESPAFNPSSSSSPPL